MNYRQFRCMNIEERTNLEYITYDSSGLYNFDFIFSGCNNLKVIKPKKLKMNSDVRSAEGMFWDCFSLQELPNINYKQLVSMEKMLYNCTVLDKLPDTFNTENCVNLNKTFYNCHLLKSISIDMTNVKEMDETFCNCKNLKCLLLYGDDTNFEGIIDLRSTSLCYTTLKTLFKHLPMAHKRCYLDLRGLRWTRRLTKEDLEVAKSKDWHVIIKEEDYECATKDRGGFDL